MKYLLKLFIFLALIQQSFAQNNSFDILPYIKNMGRMYEIPSSDRAIFYHKDRFFFCRSTDKNYENLYLKTFYLDKDTILDLVDYSPLNQHQSKSLDFFLSRHTDSITPYHIKKELQIDGMFQKYYNISNKEQQIYLTSWNISDKKKLVYVISNDYEDLMIREAYYLKIRNCFFLIGKTEISHYETNNAVYVPYFIQLKDNNNLYFFLEFNPQGSADYALYKIDASKILQNIRKIKTYNKRFKKIPYLEEFALPEILR